MEGSVYLDYRTTDRTEMSKETEDASETDQLSSCGANYSTIESGELSGDSIKVTKKSWQVKLVEPAYFFYMLAIYSYMPLNEQYVYDRVEKETPESHSLGHIYVPNACIKGIENLTLLERQRDDTIKTKVSNYTLVFNIFETLPAIVVSLILCSWGDKHGRKLGLVVPCVGGVVKGVLYVITDVYGLSIDFLMLPNLIEGMSGSHMTVAGSAYAYVADVVPQSEITFRFAVLNGLLFAGTSLGNIAVGYIISYIGYMWSFVIMTIWYAIPLLYFIFILEESVPEQPDDCSTTLSQDIKEVWQVTVTAFKVYSVERPDKNAKWRLLLMLGASTLHTIMVLGLLELETLYLIGPPFCYSPTQIGVFLAILCASSFFGPIIGTKLFDKCGIPDAVMGIIASVSGAVAFFAQAGAKTDQQINIVPFMNMYSASITALSRAIMSKDVSGFEQGAVQASLSGLSSLGDFISVTLLISIFSLTKSSYYGTVFIVMGCLSCICLILFLLTATVLRTKKVEYTPYAIKQQARVQ
ncbi:hypothetical protein CAPTEDRAFT_198749 [Capitella teleta]|uniref:Major facilitator superfamily (MFS) profile domain-containing protein n=1 Tax=Capitella teleta TaxID=283909 RepID=R7V9B0_CAPTE|nr:hypothetical protein CAPTEDRAFT_198749 [Capitella teleta]|eukprot:ELU12946.1 hypothetical protein CAPTEDRAFT_198749 [Capitella teleta]